MIWIPIIGLTMAMLCVVAAHRVGFQAGYAAGRDEGLAEGRREGQREGAKRGFAVGYDRGRRRGLQAEDEGPAAGPERPSPRAALGGLGLLLVLVVCGLICLPTPAPREEPAVDFSAPQLPREATAEAAFAGEPTLEGP